MDAGAGVLGVARDRGVLDGMRAELGDAFTPVPGDVADPGLPARLLAERRPALAVLAAGARLVSRPLHAAAYAEREGVPSDSFIARLGPPLAPRRFAAHVLDLATTADLRASYRVTPQGLHPLDGSP